MQPQDTPIDIDDQKIGKGFELQHNLIFDETIAKLPIAALETSQAVIRDDYYKCMLCLKVVIEPVECRACLKIVCGSCDAAHETALCPNCEAPWVTKAFEPI